MFSGTVFDERFRWWCGRNFRSAMFRIFSLSFSSNTYLDHRWQLWYDWIISIERINPCIDVRSSSGGYSLFMWAIRLGEFYKADLAVLILSQRFLLTTDGLHSWIIVLVTAVSWLCLAAMVPHQIRNYRDSVILSDFDFSVVLMLSPRLSGPVRANMKDFWPDRVWPFID